MNKEYGLRHCPICAEVEKALTLVNGRLKPDQFISSVDIFSNHPSLCAIEHKQGPDPMQWKVPAIVLDRPVVRRIFNSHIESRGRRVTIYPSTMPSKSILNIITQIQS
jgi:hypothetical protein